MQTEPDKPLSIIVVNWKVRDLLRGCLSSIYSNRLNGNFEVIVVDNDSKDGSVEMIKNEFSQVTLIENQQNIGFGRACNQGMKIARGEYFFILNPDTLVEPKILQNIIDFMESNPHVGVGGCYVYYPDGKPQTSFYKFPTMLSYFSRMLSLFRILPRNRFTEKFFWEYLNDNITGSVDRVLGGAMVLRREMLEQIGVFDEAYFLYAEEMDLCYRAKQKGWQVSAIPHTEIIHHHQQSSLQNMREVTFHNFKSDFLFFKKFHPIHKVTLLRMIQFCGVFLRVWTWAGVYAFSSSKKTLAREKMLGYVKLLFSNFDYSKSILR